MYDSPSSRFVIPSAAEKSLFAVRNSRFPHMYRASLRFPHLSFIPPVPYPPLRGTFPSRGRLWCGAAVFSFRCLPHGGKGSLTSPSFLWKEVPRRGGGWLSQRDERKCTIVRPLVSSSRAQPRDLSYKQENRTYEEVRHSKSYEVRCLPLPSHFLSDRCASKISRFARNDNTGKGGTLIFRP